jgi:hypothetical protein
MAHVFRYTLGTVAGFCCHFEAGFQWSLLTGSYNPNHHNIVWTKRGLQCCNEYMAYGGVDSEAATACVLKRFDQVIVEAKGTESNCITTRCQHKGGSRSLAEMHQCWSAVWGPGLAKGVVTKIICVTWNILPGYGCWLLCHASWPVMLCEYS